MNPEDILWIEKHRPRTLDEMVLDEKVRSRMQRVIDYPREMPHFLFIGTPGSGKTTLARILINHIIKDDSDLLVINGSDYRGIDVFRNLISEFLSVQPIASAIKIVFIDEGDNITSDAKKIFRALLERFHTYGRFIITANEDTFTSAIKSRFEVIKFDKLDKDYILQFCKTVLEKEGVEYTEDDIVKVIDTYYPDTRKIVGALQQNSYSGKLDISVLHIDNETKVVNYLINMLRYSLENRRQDVNLAFMTLSKFVTENYVDFLNVYKTLFNRLSFRCIPVKVTISKYTNMTVNAISPIMVFYEFLVEYIKSCEQLK
ncbi:MAG: hypothetical protein DRP47_11405, partial [Candidatus Zixiibacteriota bacterium]